MPPDPHETKRTRTFIRHSIPPPCRFQESGPEPFQAGEDPVNGAENVPASRRAGPIGVLQESSLHAALKAWYARPGDAVEARVDGYWVDIVRGEMLLEIQTGNFSAIRRKLERLLPDHPVRLIYPLAQEKWIVRVSQEGEILSRRKSPKRGQLTDLFRELVRIPHCALHPNFSLEVALIRQEDLWLDDGQGSWRRKGWSVNDRRLLGVLHSEIFSAGEDYRRFLVRAPREAFTTRGLATALGMPPPLAAKMVYTLREMGILERVGKQGRAILYQEKRTPQEG